MERVFTRDILTEENNVKFAAGTKRDWPRETWTRIGESLGLPFTEFTASVNEAARAGAIATGQHQGAIKAGSTDTPESGDVKVDDAKMDRRAALRNRLNV
jgi:hypothetical protein